MFVALMDSAGGLVGCVGFGADYGIRATAALRDMRQVALVPLNDLMKMLAAVFANRKTMNGLGGIIQKIGQFAAVAAAARELGRAPMVGRFLRDLCHARFELRSAFG